MKRRIAIIPKLETEVEEQRQLRACIPLTASHVKASALPRETLTSSVMGFLGRAARPAQSDTVNDAAVANIDVDNPPPSAARARSTSKA